MIIKASGRSALILATGLWLCFAGPSQAAIIANGTATAANSAAPLALNKNAKQSLRPWKKVVRRKSSKLALKPMPAGKDPDLVADDNASPSALPPSVANANAELTSADVAASNVKAMTARANNMLQAAPDSAAVAQPRAGTQVVSADQLNDVDRALQASASPAPTLAMASADAPAAPVLARSNESSTWDQTSLIGKLFIGFGALLTMASAARMFMA